MSKLLSIKPYDNTFFRDGNKFTKGYSNIIVSKNTPYPSVFFGAIFTALLSKNDEFRNKFLGENKNDHEDILKINQVYLHNEKQNKTYIKAPLDLFINEDYKVKFGTFAENKNTSIDQKMILMYPEGDFERVSNKYIEISIDFENYMGNYVENLELIDEESIFVKNSKVGIGINKQNGVTEESQLYKFEQTEFANDINSRNQWSYIVEYELNKDYLNIKYKNIKVEDIFNGDLKLGGEGKIAKYKRIVNSDIDEFKKLKNKIIKGKIIKILLLTDTYFDFEETIGDFFPEEIELLAMVNDKPISIGGYDMKMNNHKEMFQGFSAGTIFLCKLNNEVNLENIFPENKRGFNKYIVIEGGEINE